MTQHACTILINLSCILLCNCKTIRISIKQCKHAAVITFITAKIKNVMRITGVACKKKRIIGGFLRIAGKNNWRVFEHNRLKP